MKSYFFAIMFFMIGNIGLCEATNYKNLTSWQYYNHEIPLKEISGDSWSFDDNQISCDWLPDKEEYNCHVIYLKSKKNFDFSIAIPDFLDSTSFNAYLYKSSANNLFNVFLIEGESERGTAGYYVLILDKTKLVNHFYLDYGRAGIYSFDEAKKLLQDSNATDNEQLSILNNYSTENFDEIYINPKYFISIYSKDNKFLFKIARKYMWNADDIPITDENKFIYIEKTIN